MSDMWSDWWTAHRAEVYCSAILIPLAVVAMLSYFWLAKKNK